MSVKPLDGFQAFETLHCVTGSLRHIYAFHRYPISEELLLGLGAGVGFIYWHAKGTAPFFGGRVNIGGPGEEGLESAVGQRTGVGIAAYQSASARKAERVLLDMLVAGEPVMIRVDMGFLPYLGLPEGYHFGHHMVVAAGYDPDTQHVLIADRDLNLHPIALDVLAQARGSTYKPFPPHNIWYQCDFSTPRPPKPQEVHAAIREVAIGMLEPPIANCGVRGIRTAAERMSGWPALMSEAELRQACFNIYLFIDPIGGTGGGLFRYMYGRFLVEAASLIDDDRLHAVGQQLRTIGDQWQAVALAFKDLANDRQPAARLAAAAAPLYTIAEQEQDAWAQLRQIVG